MCHLKRTVFTVCGHNTEKTYHCEAHRQRARGGYWRLCWPTQCTRKEETTAITYGFCPDCELCYRPFNARDVNAILNYWAFKNDRRWAAPVDAAQVPADKVFGRGGFGRDDPRQIRCELIMLAKQCSRKMYSGDHGLISDWISKLENIRQSTLDWAEQHSPPSERLPVRGGTQAKQVALGASQQQILYPTVYRPAPGKEPDGSDTGRPPPQVHQSTLKVLCGESEEPEAFFSRPRSRVPWVPAAHNAARKTNSPELPAQYGVYFAKPAHLVAAEAASERVFKNFTPPPSARSTPLTARFSIGSAASGFRGASDAAEFGSEVDSGYMDDWEYDAGFGASRESVAESIVNPSRVQAFECEDDDADNSDDCDDFDDSSSVADVVDDFGLSPTQWPHRSSTRDVLKTPIASAFQAIRSHFSCPEPVNNAEPHEAFSDRRIQSTKPERLRPEDVPIPVTPGSESTVLFCVNIEGSTASIVPVAEDGNAFPYEREGHSAPATPGTKRSRWDEDEDEGVTSIPNSKNRRWSLGGPEGIADKAGCFCSDGPGAKRKCVPCEYRARKLSAPAMEGSKLAEEAGS